MIEEKTRRLGTFLVLFAAICWGFSGTCSEFLFKTRDVSSEWLTAFRMLTAGGILLAICWAQFFRGKGAHPLAILKDSYDLKRLVIFAIFGLMTVQYTYLVAISLTNSGTATVLQYSAPIFILGWSCLTYKRWPHPLEAISIICVVIGVFLLATHGHPSNLVLSMAGLVWGLSSAFALALYTILPRGILGRHGSLSVTGWGMFIGGLVFLLFTHPWHEAISWDGGMVFGLVGLVLIGTVMSFSLFLYGVKLIGPVRSSILACVEPLSAALFSHFWMGTQFTPMDIVGFIIIIMAVLILTRPTPADRAK
ncbi:DMT family transporter [Peptococcus simiae]|uniref:DMT family transporter n=1 Tax=Peptococcus simiae TaxID=1643805 RepID=UPI00397FAD3B